LVYCVGPMMDTTFSSVSALLEHCAHISVFILNSRHILNPRHRICGNYQGCSMAYSPQHLQVRSVNHSSYHQLLIVNSGGCLST
jgi:hypothetical protein